MNVSLTENHTLWGKIVGVAKRNVVLTTILFAFSLLFAATANTEAMLFLLFAIWLQKQPMLAMSTAFVGGVLFMAIKQGAL